MLTLEQLTRVATEEQALELLLDEATALKLPARSWPEGSIALTMLRIFARAYAGLTGTVRDLARAGFNETAEADWLDLFSLSHYRNARKPARATDGYVVLTAAASAGPYTFGVDELVFADVKTGQTFRNLEAGTLPCGGTLPLLIVAGRPGPEGNVPPHTITRLQTPLAGVSVDNPPMDLTGTWIRHNGAAVESDEELRERNRTKWATISTIGSPRMAYAHYALSADDAVRRVSVDDDNPRGPGTVDIYLATDTGPVSGAVVSRVTDLLEGRHDGRERIGLGARVRVRSARRKTLPLRGQVYVLGAYNNAATQRAIVQSLRSAMREVPIGGSRMAEAAPGRVLVADLVTATVAVAGVRNVSFSWPTSDLEVARDEVVVPQPQLRFVSV